jgi:hypothetical protein
MEGELSGVLIEGAAVPPPESAGPDEGVPKRISFRRLKSEERERERRWYEAHIAPIEQMLRSEAISSESLVLYTLWWQLERWLKDLTYLELIAAYGMNWTAHVQRAEGRRANQTAENAYMPSSDDPNPLSYADLGDLDAILLDQWPLFEYALIPQSRWVGRVSELKPVRHRIGHCRRPHNDDRLRVEQTLRDLSAGARQTFRTYADHRWLTPQDGMLYERWYRRSPHHDDIIEHLSEHYSTTFTLKMSQRPWASEDKLVHLHWHSRKWPIDFAGIEQTLSAMTAEECGPLIHLNVMGPYSAEAVFALYDRVAVETAIDLWIGDIVGKQRPGSPDLEQDVEYSDFRIRTNDYFSHAADMHMREPFQLTT